MHVQLPVIPTPVYATTKEQHLDETIRQVRAPGDLSQRLIWNVTGIVILSRPCALLTLPSIIVVVVGAVASRWRKVWNETEVLAQRQVEPDAELFSSLLCVRLLGTSLFMASEWR